MRKIVLKNCNMSNIKHSQDTFRSLANITEEQNYILNYLKVHVVFGESELLINNISFTIKGVSVCKNASPTIPVMFLTCCTVDIPLNVAKFKMAARKRSHIDYEQLNLFSSVVLYNTAPKNVEKLFKHIVIDNVVSHMPNNFPSYFICINN